LFAKIAAEIEMRFSPLALAILGCACAFAGPAAAQNYRWCAYYRVGGTNCGFSTFDQCQAAVSGIGGNCQENTQYSGPAKSARPAASSASSPSDAPKAKPPSHEKLVAPQPQ